MKKHIRFSALLILSLLLLCSCTADKENDADVLHVKSIDYNGLTELTAAEPDETVIKNWNRVDANPFWEYECYLTVSGENLVVSKNHEEQRGYVKRMNYGYFAGSDIGPHYYGLGFVMYYPYDWAIHDEVYQCELEPQLITAEQCRGFVEVNKQLMYLFTYENFYTGTNSVYELRITDSEYHWEWEKIAELPSYPIAYVLDTEKNLIYIVTTKELLAFSLEDYSCTTLADLSLWSGFANSMVRLNDKLYIGMAMGIYEYDLATAETKWYPIEYPRGYLKYLP